MYLSLTLIPTLTPFCLQTLQVYFTNDYPMESPIVLFQPPSPMHEHVYSNGHICLNILGADWSPALTVKSVYVLCIRIRV